MRAKGTIGYYRLESVLGEGALGTVYRATDTRFGRTVTVKVLHPDLARDPDVRVRFESEARIQAGLNHPNVASVYDFIVEERQLCVVMEFVEGRSLDEVFAQETGPMPLPTVVDIMQQAIQAVRYAHGQGVVHRNLKPSNVMISTLEDRTFVKVMGFGAAAVLGDEHLRAAAVAKPAFLRYMAPEQLRPGARADERSDIYSLGAILYRMATGRAPFDAESDASLIDAITGLNPPRPSTIDPDILPSLEAIITKTIARDPGRRFASCYEFLSALERMGAWPGRPAVTPPEVPMPLEGPTRARQPVESAPGPLLMPLPSRAPLAPVNRAPSRPRHDASPRTRWTPPLLSTRGWMWVLGAIVVIAAALIPILQRAAADHAAEARATRERAQEEQRRTTEAILEAARNRAREPEAISPTSPSPVSPSPATSQPAAALPPTAAPAPDSSSADRPAVAPVAAVDSSPAPQDASVQDRQAILQVIETWRSTVVSNDLATHMQCYAPVVDRYFSWTHASNARIESDKRKSPLRSVQFDAYAVSDVSFEALANDRARVSFHKSWDCVRPDGTRSRGHESQQLAFRKIDGRWRITSETESDVVKLP